MKKIIGIPRNTLINHSPVNSMFTKPGVQLFLLLITTLTAAAVVTLPFHGWHSLTQRSSDIAIVRCTQTPPRFRTDPNGVTLEMRDGLVEADTQTIFVLKGRLPTGLMRLVSRYWPRQSDDYLIFGHFDGGTLYAVEEYRIVPLGIGFPTNSLDGKSLDEQIKEVLRYRLDKLNREMTREQEERQRLEDGLKK